MKLRFFSLTMIVLVSCGGTSAERLVLVSNSADLSASLRKNIKTFEEVCIPFAAHETRLSLKEDMALNKRQMEDRNLKPYQRPRNCMSSTDVKWHPTQEFKSSSSNNTFEMIWPKNRGHPHFPGGSCAYSFETPEDNIEKLIQAFRKDDSRWGGFRLPPKRDPIRSSNGSDTKPKPNPKFTVFNGLTETSYWGPSGRVLQTEAQLFDKPSGLTFILYRTLMNDTATNKRTYAGITLKVKGGNNDGQWAPFMPINCP